MTDWHADKHWSDRFLPEIKGILGQFFIGEAPHEEDAERNTDLIVLRMEPLRFACRIRRPDYWERYPDQFTIREGRPSGIKSELTKIVEGWGDYVLYGFSDPTEQQIHAFGIGDLRVFRHWFMRALVSNHGVIPGIAKPNKDGSSTFRAFKWTELPAQFVGNRYRNLPLSYSPTVTAQ